MTKSGARRRLRITICALIASFAGVFVVGFMPGPRRLFLLPLSCVALATLALLWLAVTSTEGRARHFSLVTGLAAIGFIAGVLYGTLGMMAFYEINDAVFVTVVIAGAVGIVGGAAGSLASV